MRNYLYIMFDFIKAICLTIFMSLVLLTSSAISAEDSKHQFSGNYELVIKHLKEISEKYDFVTSFILAESKVKKWPIWGIKIEGIEVRGKENISQLIVGGHHGDEWGAAEVSIQTMKYFTEDRLIGKDLYIVPILMPETYVSKERYYHDRRDPNRDYPGPCGSHDTHWNKKHSADPFQLVATKALSELIEKQSIISAISIHGNSYGAYYPWGVSPETIRNPDEEVYKNVLYKSYAGTSYVLDKRISAWGDQHYKTRGMFIDYAYLKFGVWSTLVELQGDWTRVNDELVEKVDVEGQSEIHLPAIRSMLNLYPETRATIPEKPVFDCNFNIR